MSSAAYELHVRRTQKLVVKESFGIFWR